MSGEAGIDGGGDAQQPTVEQAALSPDADVSHTSPQSSNGAAAPASAVSQADRPELIVGAAFAGGFALAFLLKRLGR